MADLPRRVVWLTACLGALLGGCSEELARARRYEQGADPQFAYEEYRRVVAADADDGEAIDGMRRTAERAGEYWRDRAQAAEKQGAWDRAAGYHLKVLFLRPDDLRSLLAFRRIEREHPDDARLAQDSLDPEAMSQELLALAEKAQPPQPADANETAPTTKPAPAPPTSRPADADGPATTQPAPEAGAKTVVVAKAGPASAVRPIEDVRVPKHPVGPKPAAGSTKPGKPPAAPKAPVVRELPEPERAGPVPAVETIPPRTSDPYEQRPMARWDLGAGKGDFLKTVHISRDDDRYRKTASLGGGLMVKLRDTDDSPLDADVEIYLGRKRLGRFRDLPEDSVIEVMDEAGRRREIVIIRIVDSEETVMIGLRGSRLSPDANRR